MRYFKIAFYFLSVVLCAVSCKNDNINAGQSILPANDEIKVGTDTFSVHSSLQHVDYVYSSPDSMLLGEADTPFGTLHAEILSQLACPIGFKFPENSVIDSVVLFLYYASWYGNGNAPLSISVYELDNATFDFYESYKTNLPLDEFWSGDDATKVIDNRKIILAAQPQDSTAVTDGYVSSIKIKCSDDFAKRFFSIKDYDDQNKFNDEFKGLYITSDFGGSTILYVRDVNLALYYHYSYQKAFEDTLTTTSDVKIFYSNADVRQINRYEYINVPEQTLSEQSDSLNYIVSPALFNTRIKIPFSTMCDTIFDYIGDKRPYVNLAQLTVEVIYNPNKASEDKSYADWAEPSAYMLLVKEASADQFFIEHKLPSDTCALLSQLTTAVDDNGETVYRYTYSLSSLLTEQLRAAEQYRSNLDGNIITDTVNIATDTLNMLLIPVNVQQTSSTSNGYSTSTYISRVTPLQTISATTIKSAQSSVNPTKLEVVYSGF